jgi:peptidoglycan hydrolase CwlO-like protein
MTEQLNAMKAEMAELEHQNGQLQAQKQKLQQAIDQLENDRANAMVDGFAAMGRVHESGRKAALSVIS